jgi:DNA-binding response OmpR family regulator
LIFVQEINFRLNLEERYMGNATILLVEGRGSHQYSQVSALLNVGLQVKLVHTGTAAIQAMLDSLPQLIVFNAATMRSNGERTCTRLSQKSAGIPIIHCRSGGDLVEPNAGADVYLIQPFTSRKLLNRIRALLPADPAKEEIIRFGQFTLNKNKRSIEVEGRGEKRLTPKLTRLLEEFLRNPGRTLDRRQLMEKVWQTSYIGDTRTLDVHVRWIREYIEDDPAKPKLLKTVRSIGYVLQLAE